MTASTLLSPSDPNALAALDTAYKTLIKAPDANVGGLTRALSFLKAGKPRDSVAAQQLRDEAAKVLARRMAV